MVHQSGSNRWSGEGGTAPDTRRITLLQAGSGFWNNFLLSRRLDEENRKRKGKIRR
jgi:hypothetical protein